MQGIGPATLALLAANFGVYGLQLLLSPVGGPPLPPQLLPFALWPGGELFEPWQLVSYSFLHGSGMHVAFNMLGLLTFGAALEQVWGARRFVAFYFASVIAAALTQILVSGMLIGSYIPTVGASGGIYGLLLGFAALFPHRRIVPLIPPIPLPARIYAAIFAGLELLFGVTGTASGIAHFAHLGGMLGGGAMLLWWRRRSARG